MGLRIDGDGHLGQLWDTAGLRGGSLSRGHTSPLFNEGHGGLLILTGRALVWSAGCFCRDGAICWFSVAVVCNLDIASNNTVYRETGPFPKLCARNLKISKTYKLLLMMSMSMGLTAGSRT